MVANCRISWVFAVAAAIVLTACVGSAGDSLTEAGNRKALAAEKPLAAEPAGPPTKPAVAQDQPPAKGNGGSGEKAPVAAPARPAEISDVAARPAGWARNWPQFRGPSGDGVAPADADPPATFDRAKDVRYTTLVPAPGRSSPIVWDDRIYLTGEQARIMAFDRQTGKIQWNTAIDAPPAPAVSEPDSNASGPVAASAVTSPATPTPVTDGRFVYAFFGNGVMACVDSDGQQVWARQIVAGGPRNTYGLAASPVLYGDLLIQLVDRGADPRTKQSFVVAVRTKDGTEAWRTERPVQSCWTTPVIVNGVGGDVLVATAPPWVIAYDPKTGRQLCRAKGSSDVELSSSPTCCGAGIVMTDAGEGLTALRIGDKGDGPRFGRAWTSGVSPPRVSSPISADGRCYLFDGSDLVCIDAATGKEKWSLELEGEFWASPALAKGRVYAVSRSGTLVVASTQGKKLSQVELGAGVEASPAIVEGRLYLRTSKHLLCLGQP